MYKYNSIILVKVLIKLGDESITRLMIVYRPSYFLVKTKEPIFQSITMCIKIYWVYLMSLYSGFFTNYGSMKWDL